MSFGTQDVERKVLFILKILNSLQKPAGARVIADRLKNQGIELSERAVRYHLKFTDEAGLTKLVRHREGRIITEKGRKEIETALVKDKVGYAISKIEMLAFRTDFDFKKLSGLIPVNISLFKKEDFNKALRVMKPIFQNGPCVSSLVAIASEGEHLGELIVPKARMGLATVCSIVLNGTLLKAGVPMDSRFGGLLQVRNHQPLRFVELIHYVGSSLDPSLVFIKAKMTSVTAAAKTGDGNILANFREVPAPCRPIVEDVVARLNEAEINPLLVIGDTSEPVCEVSVEPNKIGMILVGGLNPVAATEEAGIVAENYAMSTVMEYKDLTMFQELSK